MKVLCYKDLHDDAEVGGVELLNILHEENDGEREQLQNYWFERWFEGNENYEMRNGEIYGKNDNMFMGYFFVNYIVGEE